MMTIATFDEHRQKWQWLRMRTFNHPAGYPSERKQLEPLRFLKRASPERSSRQANAAHACADANHCPRLLGNEECPHFVPVTPKRARGETADPTISAVLRSTDKALYSLWALFW